MNTFTLGLVVVIYLLAIAFLGYRGYKQTKSTSVNMFGGKEYTWVSVKNSNETRPLR